MARLFITPREIDFISDLTKEITKDVIGQSIYYYKVREDISSVHEIYEESIEKIFDPPVEIEARVQWNQSVFVTDKFGHESKNTVEVYLHYRDMIDKDIKLQEGDYFSFGSTFFELTSIKYDKILFGQVEHISGYILMGIQARRGQIKNDKPLGPTSEIYTDADAVKEEFEQQRGLESNSKGKTGDQRELMKSGVLDKPISGARKIKNDRNSSSFYGDE